MRLKKIKTEEKTNEKIIFSCQRILNEIQCKNKNYNDFLFNFKHHNLKKSFNLLNNDIHSKKSKTNNGNYYYKKGFYKNVVHIDVKSFLPTILNMLNLLDEEHQKKLKEKHEIDEKIDNSLISEEEKNQLLTKRKSLKKELNIYSSTLLKNKKDNSILRNLLIEKNLMLMDKILRLFDKNNIIHIVNDGFFLILDKNEKIKDIKKKLKTFQKYNIFFSIEKYDFVVIHNYHEFMTYKKENDELTIKDNCLSFHHYLKTIYNIEEKEISEEELLEKEETLHVEKKYFYENVIPNLEIFLKNYFKEKKENIEMDNVSFEIAKEIEEKYGLKPFAKLNTDNPKYILMDCDCDWISEPMKKSYFEFPKTMKDYSNLNNEEIEFDSAPLGIVKLKFSSDKKSTKKRVKLGNPKLYLIENDDLKVLKKKLNEEYIIINKRNQEQIYDEEYLLDMLTDLATITHLIGFRKKLSKEKIKQLENEVSKYKVDKIFNDTMIYNTLLTVNTVAKYEDDVYFYVDNFGWNNTESQKKLWFKKTYKLEDIDSKEFQKIWRNNESELELAILKLLNNHKVESVKEKGYFDKNNNFFAKDEDGKLFRTLPFGDFSLTKFDLDLSLLKDVTEEDEKKVWALFQHLTNHNEKDSLKLLTAMSACLSLDNDLRKMLNVIIFLTGIPGSGKSTLINLFKKSIGKMNFQSKDHIELSDNDRTELLNKKTVIFDDVSGLNKPNCILSNKAGQQLTSYINGDNQTIFFKYKDNYSTELIVTPFILNNYIPIINQASVLRRSIFINTQTTIFEDEQLKEIVTEDELKSDKLSLALLSLMFKRLHQIEEFVSKNKNNNNKDLILKEFYDFNPYEENILLEDNDLWPKEIEDILSFVNAESMNDLIGIHLDTLYKEYINRGGLIGKDNFIKIFKNKGFEFKLLAKNINNKTFAVRNVLQSINNKDLNKQRINQILKNKTDYFTSENSTTNSVRKFNLNDIKKINSN